MKFSESWLRTWVNPRVDLKTLGHELTMAGLEVESTEAVAGAFSGVVVGEIIALAPHPDADKLRVCQVEAGLDAPLQIVCGAPNAALGMKAPLATIGAQLPGGLTIKKGKLRGVESFGMLCSAKELGLADEASGLLPLPTDAPPGMDIRTYLQLDDTSIELSITPNRGDCLGIQGIAREVGALFALPIQPPAMPAPSVTCAATLAVEVSAPDACPRYAGRIIKNLDARAATPLWLKERLRRSGLRSINAVVDVTNYVLLELGQPLHAFDLARLNGGVRVRNAHPGEKLILLDGQEITLDENTLVIADHTAPQALAGIMGGAASAVSDATTDIFLESAFFSPTHLAGCARRYGLQTDSSYRFERGVDFELQVRALERASALILEICGGEAGPMQEVCADLPPLPPIALRAARLQMLLGANLPNTEISAILTRLGMQVQVLNNDSWQVTPPSFRFDVRTETDLIEEVARVYGYAKLPRTAPQIRMSLRQPQTGLNTLQSCLVARGYQEAITYSFVDPVLQAQVQPDIAAIALSNPISQDMAVMRTSLWTGLLQALSYNQKRRQNSVRLFETGLRFVGDAQEAMLAGLAWGLAQPEQWAMPKRNVDFYDVKGDLEALLAQAGLDCRFSAATHPALHPGQTAKIFAGDREIGLLGALHPSITNSLDLPSEVYLFELQSAPLTAQRTPAFQAVSKFPAVRRDLALIVAQDVSAQALLDGIGSHEWLSDLRLFDVYQGQGIEEGKKSLALGLTFRSALRSLTEEEVDSVVAQILRDLAQNLQASLRE
jgi:phenylalanyl-tRNA synthetase beta chain